MRRIASLLTATLLIAAGIFSPDPLRQAPMKKIHMAGLPKEVEASGNWSGYVLTGKYAEVKGTFTVPSVPSPTGVAAEWVGIDGVSNEDLIQAGVSESGGYNCA